MSFWKSKYWSAVMLVLLLQAATFYAVASRPETVPSVLPLSTFPTSIGSWGMTQNVPIQKEVLELLKADDTLNRVYVSPVRREVTTLYIAYFRTQRYGQSPHSPKNCLPGSGWEPIDVRVLHVPVKGWDTPIAINRYVVQHGDEKSVTFYWYQSHNRVIATEYSAKFWLVADAIRYHRSDTALVRVIAPVRDNNVEAASASGIAFINDLFPYIQSQLPL